MVAGGESAAESCGVRRQGADPAGRCLGRCPLHEDHTPSLVVTGASTVMRS